MPVRREKRERRERKDRMNGPPPKSCKLLEDIEVVDYKDSELLRKFISERGKITPRRGTYASAKQQRQIKRAIRRARVMGLLP